MSYLRVFNGLLQALLSRSITAALMCTILVFSLNAQAAPSKSYQVKAGYLLHFASYVTWPDENLFRIRLCIVGDDPFGDYIDEMVAAKPQTRQGLPIVVSRKNVGEALTLCQIVYTAEDSVSDQFWSSLNSQQHTLLVGEGDEYLYSPGMVRFFVREKYVRLEINLQRVLDAGLTISSELLKISTITSDAS